MESAEPAAFSPHLADQLSQLIRHRRTTKVMANVDSPVAISDSDAAQLNTKVLDAIADAGFAPFHYDRKSDGLAEPWRFYVLWHQDCRRLSRLLPIWCPDLKPGNKLPSMLAACGALILVNWLPQFAADAESLHQTQINEEHLAATAAAIQVVLLKLTAENLRTYWSSGGQLGSSEVFEKLGIHGGEKLLAAVFVNGHTANDVELIGGKNRNRRSPAVDWTRVLSVEPSDHG